MANTAEDFCNEKQSFRQGRHSPILSFPESDEGFRYSNPIIPNKNQKYCCFNFLMRNFKGAVGKI